MERLKSQFDQKQNDIKQAAAEHHHQQEKIAEAKEWLKQQEAELNKLAENPTTVDDCKDLLQLVSSIRNQVGVHRTSSKLHEKCHLFKMNFIDSFHT